MNQTFAFVLVIIAMLIGAGMLFTFMGETESDTITDASSTEKLDAILDRLDAIESRQADVDREVGALRQAATRPVVIPPGELDAAVDRALARRIPAGTGGMNPAHGDGAGDEEAVAAAADEGKPSVAARLRRLEDPNLKGRERWALLAELAEEGLLDDAIETLEARAEKNAGNPDAQVDLGEAYISKIIDGKVSFMERGNLANKAYAAYDKAISLDPDHLRARVDKGTSYYWSPPQLGLEKKALKELEHAARIQSTMKPEDDFARTHWMIGNLHERMGEREKARAAWKRGLDRFPDNKELLEKLKD